MATVALRAESCWVDMEEAGELELDLEGTGWI